MYDPHSFAADNNEIKCLKLSKLGEVWGESGKAMNSAFIVSYLIR